MDYNLIKKIVGLVERSDIHELEVESEGLRVKVNKDAPPQQVIQAPAMHPEMQAAMAQMTATPFLPSSSRKDHPLPGQEAPAGEEAANAGTVTINSPMVGTFYRAPSPESPPFVKVGDQVNNDTVVCILEAMKVMNEIKAELSGKVVEILVENAQPVEFGQALFRIEA